MIWVSAMLSLSNNAFSVANTITYEQLGRERSTFPDVSAGNHTAYYERYSMELGPTVILFPVGHADARYFLQADGYLSRMTKTDRRARPDWWVGTSPRASVHLLSGVGTLDALLGRSKLGVVGYGGSEYAIQTSLDAVKPFAAYQFLNVAGVVRCWVIHPDGSESPATDIDASKAKAGFPVLEVERTYLEARQHRKGMQTP